MIDRSIFTSSPRSWTENDDKGTHALSNLAEEILLALEDGCGILSKQHALSTERGPISPASSTTHSRRRAFVIGVGVSSFSSLFKHRPLFSILFVYSGRQDETDGRVRQERVQNQQPSNRNPNHTHQRHCEDCYDYDPVRCPSTVVIALLAFIIVIHDYSTLTTNEHLTPVCWLLAVRCKGMK